MYFAKRGSLTKVAGQLDNPSSTRQMKKAKLLCHDFSLMQQDCLVFVAKMLLMNAPFGPFRSELSSDKVHRFLEKELVQPPRPHQL